MNHHRLTHSAALGLLLAAFVAPTATAQQDLRSPDTRDAAAAAEASGDQDRFSVNPSTGYATPARTASASQDLRAPDTHDYAEGRGTFNSPEVTVVKIPEASPSPSSGLDWGDAGIGAGTMLGLLLLGLGGTLVVLRRKQGRQPATVG